MTYRRATGLLLAGFLVSLVGSGVVRAEQKIFGLKTSGDIEIGGRVYADRPPDDARAKLEEYRDLSESAFLQWLRLRGDSEDDFYTVEIFGKNGGLDDQEFQLHSYGVGSFDFLFEWNQIPHNISRNSQTFLVETSPATFTLPTPRPSPLTDWNLSPKIDELGFRTDNALVEFSYAPTPDWDIGVDFRRSYKHGNRPLGLPFGTPGNNAVEVPVPIKDTSYEVDASAAFAGDGYQLQFNYLFSLFDNDFDAGFRADNPCFGLPAGSPAGCGGSSGGAAAPPTGQGALAPDNYGMTFTLGGGVDLGMQTRLNGSFSYSWRKQDADFLPFTINSALFGDPDLQQAQAALPNDLDGEVGILRFNLTATSRPMDRMTATAKFRVFNYDDKTSEIPFTFYVEDDRAVVAPPVRGQRARRFPYTKWNAGADVRYQLLDPLAVKVGLYWERWDRRADDFRLDPADVEEGGDAVLHVPREVDNTNEYTPKVMLDYTPLDWLLFRASYAYSKRTNSDYKQATEDQFALLRKYTQSDRDRNRVDVLADVMPMDNLMFTATFNWTKDQYKDSRYGLQDGKSWAAGFDTTWKALERLKFFAGYLHEEWDNDSRQKFRTPTSGGQLNNPTFDWESDVEDRYDTFRVGFDTVLIPKMLDGGANLNYSNGRTKMNASNPVTPTGGGSASAVAEDFPEIENEQTWLNVFLRYWLTEKFSTKVQYSFEKGTFGDFRSDGLFPYNELAGGNVIFLGNNLPNYTAHYFTLSVGYHF